MYNPYLNNPFSYSYTSNSPNPVEIPHVNGQNGAQAYQMPCNSSVLLLDDNAPIVYLVRTDSACYKTIKPYKISEITPEPDVDVRSLLDRVNAIERRLNESHFTADEHVHSEPSRASQVFNEYDSIQRKSNGSDGKFHGKQSTN